MVHSNIYCSLSGFSLTSLVLLACFGSLAQASDLTASVQKLKIPEQLIPISSYTGVVRVQLNGNDVKPGDPIPARSFKSLDHIKIGWDYSSDTMYTLMLLDLDRKPAGAQTSNASLSMYNQYTNINIPGNQINSGQAIVAFHAPNVPCHPSTKHRLVLLVFQQDDAIDIAKVVHVTATSGHSERRENFKLENFVRDNRLSLVAANIFSALGESGGACSGAISASSSISLLMVTLAALAGVWRSGLAPEKRPL